MRREEFLKPVPEQSKAGWSIEQVGAGFIERVQGWHELKAASLRLKQNKLGWVITYGQGPRGYDQVVIQEPGGGGAVIAPYVRINGELYVGANKVSRHLTGRLITELPRGAANVGEAHSAVAKRELMEETGAVESVANRVKPLGGPVNPNSTFFKTDIGKGEGVKLFEIELRPEELTLRRDSEDPRRRVYILKPESQGEITEKDEGISPKGLRFFHISLLAGSPDSFTLAALARLQNKK